MKELAFKKARIGFEVEDNEGRKTFSVYIHVVGDGAELTIPVPSDGIKKVHQQITQLKGRGFKEKIGALR